LITSAKAESRSSIEPSPDEMLAISREIALEFSPSKASLAGAKPCPPTGFAAAAFPTAMIAAERKETKNFGYRELQAISEDIGRRFMPTAANTAPEILLLPVDPHHLYAYWNSPSQPSAPELQARKPLTLRIYWRPDTKQELSPLNLHFDAPADNPENRKKIRLPIDDTYYSAALGRLNPDHSLEVLAHSNLVHVPALPGKKRMAPQENTAGEEPMRLLCFGQEVSDSIREKKGPAFAGSASMPSNPDFQPDSTPELTEPMSFFNETAAGSKRHTEPEPKNPIRHASGRGL
jgi:hypothetical protein